jgi:hypothetical protein
MSKHVLIFTPTYGDGPHPECIPSVNAQVFDGRVEHQVSWHNPYPGRDFRNVLAQYERAHEWLLSSPADALLLVEHDMVLPVDALTKLYATDAPVVYGLYIFRHGMLVLNACRYENHSAVGESLSLYPAEEQAAQRRGWADVSGLGFGCTLIRRSVLEQLRFRPDGDLPLPDRSFALDCVRTGIRQVARFDVPVTHIDGDTRLIVGKDFLMVEVTALQNVTVPTGNGVHPLIKGRTYKIARPEAVELQRAGYVQITPEPETEPEPAEVVTVKPKRRKVAE